ncbi:hypothetical protein N657DRAFT_442211 [Parathielavia appendiculata]|uniref:Uncharacterized protein n=1 Tax=Parathielavia appendiculata TaxID=2587402 RepID=A0AAN6TP31_9PEZI|nr:hypothetical protein N657DRAFT_442211 [Parathielavia appendiculata]
MALTVFGGRPPASIIAQLSESCSSSDADRFDGFPIARWRGRCFIEDERLWMKGSRPPRHGLRTMVSSFARSTKAACDLAASGSVGAVTRSSLSILSTLSKPRVQQVPISKKMHKMVAPSKQVDSSESEPLFCPSKRPRYAQVPQVREIQELLVGHIVNASQPFGIAGFFWLADRHPSSG